MNYDPRAYDLLTPEEVEQKCRVSSRTISRLTASGRFPKPIKIGHSNRWRAGDVNAFLQRGGTAASNEAAA